MRCAEDRAGGRARGTAGAWRRRRDPILLSATTVALVAGGIAWLAGRGALADACWAGGTVVAVVPAVAWVVDALRRGRVGVDLIAVLALAGTLVVGEYLAGTLIAVMLATGRTLEAAAGRRASRDLRALLERAPRSARCRRGGEIASVDLEEVGARGAVRRVAPRSLPRRLRPAPPRWPSSPACRGRPDGAWWCGTVGHWNRWAGPGPW
ncbi:hypothetical protein GCM10010341_47300 [Streptomyces noursei]|nr:hypothetical protein GCM10010341_47300 [Streptomyces noursei]